MRDVDLLSGVRRAIEKDQLLERGAKVVVAVSGGPDSICLLFLLLQLRDEWGLSLHVAHFNHASRGSESDRDAEWVSAKAEALGIPSSVGSADVSEWNSFHRSSPEEGLRSLRYRFLFEVAETVGASRIATGHTMNDQAETLLLRLARGTGLSGMDGIRPIRGKLIRPLLRITRREVLAYLHGEGIEYREDSSNRDLVYDRNRVRMEVIPVLEKHCNLRIVELLGRYAELAHADNAYLDAAAEREIAGLVIRDEPRELVLNRVSLGALDVALRRRVLRAAVRRLTGSLRGITSHHVLSCLQLKTGKRLDLPAGLTVSRHYDELVLSTSERDARDFEYEFEIPGRIVVRESGLMLSAELVDGANHHHHPDPLQGDEVVFDVDGIEPPLAVRRRRPGDRMRPFGMEGERKVKDIFIDDKIPRSERDFTPLVADQAGLLWIVGIRRSNRSPVTKSTKRLLRLRADRNCNGDRR